MNLVRRNLLDVRDGVICHQVNCMGVMGGGLALSVREKYPEVYRIYKEHCSRSVPDLLLGQCLVVPVTPTLHVANLFGQKHYGTKVRQTDYEALNTSLTVLAAIMENNPWYEDKYVYFPYNMGCGLAGGEWSVVYAILATHFPKGIIVRL